MSRPASYIMLDLCLTLNQGTGVELDQEASSHAQQFQHVSVRGGLLGYKHMKGISKKSTPFQSDNKGLGTNHFCEFSKQRFLFVQYILNKTSHF